MTVTRYILEKLPTFILHTIVSEKKIENIKFIWSGLKDDLIYSNTAVVLTDQSQVVCYIAVCCK